MRVTDKFIYFWGEWPSNFQTSKFTTKFDGKERTFHNAEQFFMFTKAMTFKDYDIAEKIIKEGIDPKKARLLGRKVSGYNDEVWNEIRYKVMLKANMCKYTQNEDLKKKLLDRQFDGKHFVEASPIDIIWGIGVDERDAKDDRSNWLGQNLLGQVLDEVREKLKQDEQKNLE